uniref:Uncharacterized protein n=1 Tax=Parascaris univalens TaxID=6257 RepID=A0A914ZI31_PARUN
SSPVRLSHITQIRHSVFFVTRNETPSNLLKTLKSVGNSLTAKFLDDSRAHLYGFSKLPSPSASKRAVPFYEGNSAAPSFIPIPFPQAFVGVLLLTLLCDICLCSCNSFSFPLNFTSCCSSISDSTKVFSLTTTIF